MAYTTIDDPSAYFQTKIYTGNATDDTAYTNDGNSDLQADLLWAKNRDVTVDHVWFDSTRGVTKNVRSNNANTESTNSNYLKSFNSDGFTMGTSNRVNGNTNDMVAWQWKANGGTETHSQSESGSNIACSVQANTTAGFSIITYTGTGTAGHTFLHGLGSAPHVIIIKCRSVGHHWRVYHHKNTSAPQTDALSLNQTDATSDQDYWWDDTAPNSTEIALGNGDSGLNDDGATHVAYCWKEVQGYSKFGSYTGNDNADGPFIYTGFKPAWVMIKKTDATGNWIIKDNKIDTDNPATQVLYPNLSNAENDAQTLDLLSNGFKHRSAEGDGNDANSYIYMAFAEQPFVSSEGVPCTAR